MADTHTRQAKRTPVTLKIKFKSATLDQFIERYSVDVSHGGIFIRTKDPLPVGTTLRFEFQLRDASPLITGEGTVVWTREHDPTRTGVAPGMGVRFDRLAEGSQAVLDKILAQKSAKGGRDTHPPVFNEAPTRVAPSPLVAGLAKESNPKFGNMAPRTSSFVDERTDATPLPSPMPFHSDADDFPEEAFEEATKVRSLDELVAATRDTDDNDVVFRRASNPATRSDESEPEVIVDELAQRRSQLPTSETDEAASDGAGDSVVASDQANASLVSGNIIDEPAASDAGDFEHDFGDLNDRVELEHAHTAVAARPGSTTAERYEEDPPVAAAVATETGGGGWKIVAALTVLLAAGGAGFWYWQQQQLVAEQSAPPIVAVAPETADVAPAPEPEPVATARATIETMPEGAMVELLGESTNGPSPMTLDSLEEGKQYAVRISHPGFLPVEKSFVAAASPVQMSVELEPMNKFLLIESEPEGALVFINGTRLRDTTPAEVALKGALGETERYRISVRKRGHEKSDVTVAANEGFEERGDRLVQVVTTVLEKRQVQEREDRVAKPEPTRRPTAPERELNNTAAAERPSANKPPANKPPATKPPAPEPGSETTKPPEQEPDVPVGPTPDWMQ